MSSRGREQQSHSDSCGPDAAGSRPRRVLFVGEAPTRVGARPLHPDDCDSGRRLLQYTGWDRADYLGPHCERTNVFDVPTPAKEWSTYIARERVCWLDLDQYSYVVFLGRKVAASYVHSAAFLEWQRCPPISVAICPHPSGMNRWWNDEQNRREARRFFNRLWTDLTGGMPWKTT